MPFMKTTRVLLATLCITIAQAASPLLLEDIVTSGPRAGEKRIITNTVAFPPEATVLDKASTITLGPPTARTALSVELISRRHTFITESPSGAMLPGARNCYEFEIRSVEPGRFVWSCWVGDWRQPHRFQVLRTESGKSYACYIREGVHLFHLSESRPAAAMRRGLWENSGFDFEHPDALPLLRQKQIRGALGPECMLHLDATTGYTEVLALSDQEGELRLTVRGREPQPIDYSDARVPEGMRERWLRSSATFALRDGCWQLVSATPQ